MVWENVPPGHPPDREAASGDGAGLPFGRWRTFLRVRVPSVLPYFLAACTTGLGFAWKSAIAAEVISRPASFHRRRLQRRKGPPGDARTLRLDGGRHCVQSAARKLFVFFGAPGRLQLAPGKGGRTDGPFV